MSKARHILQCSRGDRSPGPSSAISPWVPACAGTRPNASDRGFTLIELLVALMIFSLLAAAGVMLLRGSVDTQSTVRTHLDALADVQRGIATLDSDLSQAVARISRTRTGTSAPAFFGRGPQHDDPIMQFVRGGWTNPARQRHPGIQRIEYWWRDGKLQRIGYLALDGAEAPEPATLFDHVTDLQLKYRNAKGEWLDVWAPGQPDDLPVAVEMIVTRAGEAPLTLRFLIGPGVGQRPDQTAPNADSASGAVSNGV